MAGKQQRDLFASSDERVYTVSELASEVRALLEGNFALVRVIGEISSLSVAASGHAYFSLKDENASMPAVMFRSAITRIGGAVPEEGTEVECLGRLTFYEPRGRSQLVVEWMVPRGAGALGLKFLQLKEKLSAEGLFDPERKRPIPFLPECVGIVTSPTGAAVRDILKVLSRRFPSVPVLICPVRVQGEGAAEQIARAVGRMGAGRHCDVLIVGRGGGSLEDLWAFNEEEVVRAVVASKVPVISAVGHEVDLVLSDLAADVRAQTPTAAAEMVVPDRGELQGQMEGFVKDLHRVMQIRISAAQNRLMDTTRRIRDPRRVIDAYRLRLDEAERTAQNVVRLGLERARKRMMSARLSLAARDPGSALLLSRNRLESTTSRLKHVTPACVERRRVLIRGHVGALASLNPLAVLERGYCVVSRPDGRVLRESSQVSVGDWIHVRLHQGSLDGTVDLVHPDSKKK